MIQDREFEFTYLPQNKLEFQHFTKSYPVSCHDHLFCNHNTFLGKLFEYYLGALNPSCDRLFQREVLISKKFNIHTTQANIWFTNQAVGKSCVPKMLPLLLKTVGMEHLTNHSLRATAISASKRAGFEDRAVGQSLSGHKNLANLASYNRPTDVQRLQMSVGIMHGKAIPVMLPYVYT